MAGIMTEEELKGSYDSFHLFKMEVYSFGLEGVDFEKYV